MDELSYYLEISVQGGEEAQQVLARVQEALQSLPGIKNIQLSLAGDGEVLAGLDKTKAAIDGLPESKAIQVRLDLSGLQKDLDRVQETLANLPGIEGVRPRIPPQAPASPEPRADQASRQPRRARPVEPSTKPAPAPEQTAPAAPAPAQPAAPPPPSSPPAEPPEPSLAEAAWGEWISGSGTTPPQAETAGTEPPAGWVPDPASRSSWEPLASRDREPEETEPEKPGEEASKGAESFGRKSVTKLEDWEKALADVAAGRTSPEEAEAALTGKEGKEKGVAFRYSASNWTPEDLRGAREEVGDLVQEGGKLQVSAKGAGRGMSATASTKSEAQAALTQLKELMDAAAKSGEKLTVTISGTTTSMDALARATEAVRRVSDQVAAREDEAKLETRLREVTAGGAARVDRPEDREADDARRIEDLRRNMTERLGPPDPEEEARKRRERDITYAKSTGRTPVEAEEDADTMERARAARWRRAVDAAATDATGSPRTAPSTPDEDRDKRIEADVKRAKSFGMSDADARAAADAFEAARMRRFRDSLEEATHSATAWSRGLDMIRRGALRAGVATIASDALGGGGGAAFLGAMTGVIASAIAFPIAWAIGNVLSDLPQKGIEELEYNRYREGIGARAGGKLEGADWLRRLGNLEGFFGSVRNEKGEPMRWEAQSLMREYQARGVRSPDQAQEAQVAERRAILAGLLGVAGLEVNRESLMRTFKDLDYGTQEEKTNAMKELAGRSYVRQKLLSQIMRDRRLPNNAKGEWLAEQELSTRLSIPYGTKGAYTRENMLGLMEQTAQNDPRVIGQMNFQRSFWWWRKEQDWGPMLFGPRAGQWKSNERQFVIDYAKIQKDLSEGKVTTDEAEQRRQKARRWAGSLSWSNINNDKPSVERLDELEKWTRARIGQLDQLPFKNRQEAPTPGFMPAQYHWTSFSGLAEQMQMMWSGAPADAMGSAANKLASAATSLQNAATLLAGGQQTPSDRGNPTPPQPVVVS